MAGGQTVTGRTGDPESGDDREGGEAPISAIGGKASGKTVRPLLFDPLASVGCRGRLKEAMRSEWKVPCCEKLSVLSKDIVSIGCAKAVVIGSLGVSASWRNGIG